MTGKKAAIAFTLCLLTCFILPGAVETDKPPALKDSAPPTKVITIAQGKAMARTIGGNKMSITKETRREAYQNILPKIAPKEAQVLGALTTYGPMTAEEIMERLGTRNPNNVRPRLTGLKKRGMVRDIERKKDADGHSAAVW